MSDILRDYATAIARFQNIQGLLETDGAPELAIVAMKDRIREQDAEIARLRAAHGVKRD